jgi:hypothetical protein
MNRDPIGIHAEVAFPEAAGLTIESDEGLRMSDILQACLTARGQARTWFLDLLPWKDNDVTIREAADVVKPKLGGGEPIAKSPRMSLRLRLIRVGSAAVCLLRMRRDLLRTWIGIHRSKIGRAWLSQATILARLCLGMQFVMAQTYETAARPKLEEKHQVKKKSLVQGSINSTNICTSVYDSLNHLCTASFDSRPLFSTIFIDNQVPTTKKFLAEACILMHVHVCNQTPSIM